MKPIPPEEKRDQLFSFVPPPEPEEAFKPEWPVECPAPGVYDVSFEDYRSWPAINASALKIGYQVSAKHMKAAIDGTLGGDSTARKFGRAIHARLLEPDTFAERFLVAGRCQELLKSGKRKGQPCGKWGRYLYDGTWYCGAHSHEAAVEPTEYISGDEAERIECMVKSVYSHSVVKMLSAHGGAEVSVVWDWDGFACKARFDKWITEASCPDTIVDLKKCQVCKADDDSLQKSIRTYGWDMQAAFYSVGAEKVTGNKPLWAWVFLEDANPFDVRPLWASKPMLELGAIKMRKAFSLYKQCVEWGKWPGYCETIEELLPSDYEMKNFGLLP